MYNRQRRRISAVLLFFLVLQCSVGFSQQLNRNARASLVTATLQLSTSVTTPSCAMINGSILATATGGTPPYTYSFAGWPFQSNRLWLCKAGTYPVVVKDATGATDTVSVIVKNNYPFVWGAPTTFDPSGCATPDGRVRIDAYDGTPPYTYSLDNINFQASSTFTNLLPGQYYFIIKDANGCSYVSWFFLRSNNCQVLNAANSTKSTSVCNNDGAIDFSLWTARQPVAYSLDGINYQPSGVFTGLGPGSHTLYMTDGDGKKYAYAINMYHDCPVVTSAAVTDAACGINNGSIIETVTSGTPPYQYSIDGVNFQSGNIFSGVAPGKHTIIVKDATGLLKMDTATIAENCPTVTATGIAATCGNTGSITATAAKGTALFNILLTAYIIKAVIVLPVWELEIIPLP